MTQSPSKPKLNEYAQRVLAAIAKTKPTTVAHIVRKTGLFEAAVRRQISRLHAAGKVNYNDEEETEVVLCKVTSKRRTPPMEKVKYTAAMVKAKLDLEITTAFKANEPCLFFERCLLDLYEYVPDRSVFGKEVRSYIDIIRNDRHLSQGQVQAAYHYVANLAEQAATLLNRTGKLSQPKKLERFTIYFNDKNQNHRIETIKAANRGHAIVLAKQRFHKNGFFFQRIVSENQAESASG